MQLNIRHLALLWMACLLACAIVNLFYFPPALILPDEQRFVASALRLAQSGEFWVGDDRAWEMPGTALFFAPAVKLFGATGAVLPIRFMQSLLLVAQSALIAVTARRLFGTGLVALLAASMIAFYPFLLFYQGLLMSEMLFTTLMVAGIAALYWWRERGCRIDIALVLTCLCFAVAALVKPTLTLLPPLLIAWTAWTAGAPIRRALAILLAAAGLYAALLSPWWIRNAVVLGEFVPFTTGSAENLYLGNNPHNSDAGIDWASDVEPEVVARIRALPGETVRQHAFAQQAISWIKAHPADFVALCARKFLRFWNIVPNAREFSSTIYRIVSAASFGPVLLLALLCAVRRWRQWRLLSPLYVIVGYFTLLHVVTIASLRYRFPIEPILILLAAEPLAALIVRLRPGVAHANDLRHV